MPYSSLAEYKGKGPIVVLVADRQQAVAADTLASQVAPLVPQHVCGRMAVVRRKPRFTHRAG